MAGHDGHQQVNRVRSNVHAGDHPGTRPKHRKEHLHGKDLDRFSYWTGRDLGHRVEGTSALVAWPVLRPA